MKNNKITIIGLNFMGGLSRSVMISRGVLFVLLGVLLLVCPLAMIKTIIQVLGVILVINGIGGLFTRQTATSNAMRWAYPLLTIILGLFAFFMPGETQLTILMFVAAWFLLSGGIQLAMLFSPGNGSAKALIGMSAVINLLIGILFVTHPITGLAAFIWLFAVFLIAGGVFTIVLGCCMPQITLDSSDLEAVAAAAEAENQKADED